MNDAPIRCQYNRACFLWHRQSNLCSLFYTGMWIKAGMFNRIYRGSCPHLIRWFSFHPKAPPIETIFQTFLPSTHVICIPHQLWSWRSRRPRQFTRNSLEPKEKVWNAGKFREPMRNHKKSSLWKKSVSGSLGRPIERTIKNSFCGEESDSSVGQLCSKTILQFMRKTSKWSGCFPERRSWGSYLYA